MQTPSPEVRASLTRLARSSDRTSPTVFAGRERELNLLNDYIAFRFDRRESTIVLLVDEAQSLTDSTQVRTHLDALHGGIKERIVFANSTCRGLQTTTSDSRTRSWAR